MYWINLIILIIQQKKMKILIRKLLFWGILISLLTFGLLAYYFAMIGELTEIIFIINFYITITLNTTAFFLSLFYIIKKLIGFKTNMEYIFPLLILSIFVFMMFYGGLAGTIF